MSIDGFMVDVLTGNLLKYAAGRAIFCPKCGGGMDWQRTAVVGSQTICTDCLLVVLKRYFDRFGMDATAKLVADADITMAHNIHVGPDGVTYGSLALTDA